MSLDLAFKGYTPCAVEEGTSTLLHFEGYSVGKSLGQETPIRFAVCRTFPDRTKRITKKPPRDYSLIPSASSQGDPPCANAHTERIFKSPRVSLCAGQLHVGQLDHSAG